MIPVAHYRKDDLGNPVLSGKMPRENAEQLNGSAFANFPANSGSLTASSGK